MNKVAVIIPAYLEALNQFELASFKQCNLVLNHYPKILVCHSDLEVGIYEKHVPGIKYEYFEKKFFESVEGYNRLLLSYEFYKRFDDFEYILIYQLDSWVFRDELEYWCQKGYDYIGSPWFENFGSQETGDKLWKVGNGGFSLRRVPSFLNTFNFKKRLFKIKGLKIIHPEKTELLKHFKRFLLIYSKTLGLNNSSNYYIKKFEYGEDTFWSLFLQKSEIPMKIPKCEEAISFSFERSPEYLYELSGGLPFGCHAWGKHDYNSFWKNFIKVKY